jgi:hypothetical protein
MATDYDPYAPPAEPEHEPGRHRSSADYALERRPIGLFILLCFATLGFYPIIWLFKRRAFLESLDANAKLGPLPVIVAVCRCAVYVLVFAQAASHATDLEPLIRMIQLADWVAMLMAVFRIATILRSDFSRSGRFLTVSGVATFFFGTLYLQYKINQAADTPPLKRRKKKKKLREAVKDAAAEEAAEEPRA